MGPRPIRTLAVDLARRLAAIVEQAKNERDQHGGCPHAGAWGRGDGLAGGCGGP